VGPWREEGFVACSNKSSNKNCGALALGHLRSELMPDVTGPHLWAVRRAMCADAHFRSTQAPLSNLDAHLDVHNAYSYPRSKIQALRREITIIS
jgi:hypothetical protein